MDKNLVRFTAIASVAFSVFILAFIGITAQARPSVFVLHHKNLSALEMLGYNTKKAQTVETKDQKIKEAIRIKLPDGITPDMLQFESDYVNQTMRIFFPNTKESYFYDNPIIGSSDNIKELAYGVKSGGTTVDVVTDNVYEHVTEYSNGYLYLEFVKAKSIYDKVVVIDAGHGGTEPGKPAGEVLEKNINLAIVLKLKALLDENEDIKAYYTRTDDSCPSFFARSNLANDTEADMFISIHNNSNDSYLMGTQVMWDEKKEYEGLGTYELSEICLDEVTKSTGGKKLGFVDGHSIYIIRTSKVPMCLIEAGFMTNESELKNLLSESYQQAIAQGVYNGIIRAYKEGF